MDLNSLDIRIYSSNFTKNMFMFGARKNIFITTFLDTQKLHSWRTSEANVCSCKSPFKSFCSRNVENFYLVGA